MTKFCHGNYGSYLHYQHVLHLSIVKYLGYFLKLELDITPKQLFSALITLLK